MMSFSPSRGVGHVAAEIVARFERWLIAAASVVGLLLAASMAFDLHWDDPGAPGAIHMVDQWLEIVRLHQLQAIAFLFPALVMIDALLATALALALTLHAGDQPVRLLRRALALGALAVLYLMHVRMAWPLPPALRLPLDVAAFVAAAGAGLDLCAFFAGYPRRPRPDQILAYAREQSDFRPMFGVGRLRRRANRLMQSLLARHLPRRFVDPIGSEAQIARMARSTTRFLELADDTRVRCGILLLAILAGSLFAVAMHRPGAGFAVQMFAVIGGFLPLLGFGGLQVNYRYGDADDRRRIAWIYLGPAIGFFVGSLVYWLMGLAMFAVFTGHQLTVAGLEIPALWVASMLLFMPFVTLCFLCGLGFSIFYRGALSPRLAIRRGAVITLCGLLLTALFVVVEGAITSQAVLRFGLPDETGAVVAGTLAAVAFAPVRNWVEARVSRLVEQWMPVQDLAGGRREILTVCFVDLCGYTALSEKDESTALLQAALLRKVAQATCARQRGDLVKALGDGMMMRFASPGCALAALREIASEFDQGARALRVEPLAMHAGLHHGEVVLGRDGDLFGAEVNLAARLCAAAATRQVLMSDDAARLCDEPSMHAEGELALKNIAVPVSGFSVVLG